MGQLLLSALEVARISYFEHLFSVCRGAGVEGRDADIDSDDLVGLAGDRNLASDLNGEGHAPFASSYGDGGRHDLAGTTIQVSVELSGGLVCLDLTNSGNAHVVCVDESHDMSHEPHRACLPLSLELRELSPSCTKIGEGHRKTLGRVVVSA